MDNYNFTKGKWYYEENYDEKYSQPTFRIGTENLSEFITIWSGLERYDEINIETKANALLISKAPEMLELINEFYLMCIQKTFPTEHELVYMAEKAKKLIKEATEL